jgi:hypothetical protein
MQAITTNVLEGRKERAWDDIMVYDGGKRLEIYGLIERLGDAVRNNDLTSARLCRERLAFFIEAVDPADPAKPVHDAVEQVFRLTGTWERRVAVNSDDLQVKKQIQEAVDHALPLLNI